MTRLFPKKIRPAGLPPGSLLYTGSSGGKKIRLSIFEYGEDKWKEKKDASVEECLQHINMPTMTWIQVHGVFDPDTVASIGKTFKLHALFIEDIVSTGQRPKLDVFDNQVFIVARSLQYEPTSQALKDEQISIVFGNNYLITFLEGNEDIFKPIEDRLRQGSNRIRKQGSDFLAYALLDTIVDYYFVVLEKVDISLDSLEEELITFPKANTLQKVQHAKREMIILRKAIWPMRDVINRLAHLDDHLVDSTTKIYLQDVHDHTVQTIDIIESFRDVVGGMIDIYLSNINIRTNDIMKVLTIVSTIFVPLTFISSLYGMNFEHMPELHTQWGYPLVVCTMGATAISMLIFFRRRKWI
ncbi:MAG: magnesium/cobalt transporter CorA [Parachlamydiaceae bacterium]